MLKFVKPLFYFRLLLILGMGLMSPHSHGQLKKDNYTSMIKDFQNPHPRYSTVPFWVWNYIITKPMIDEQLKIFKNIGITQVIIHPRPGLVTEYLSKEWFDLIKYAIFEAKKLNMKVMLYDENSYPSGFAGGHVPAQLPENMIKFLLLKKTNSPDTIQNKLCVLKNTGAGFEKIADDKYEKDITYYVFHLVPKEKNQWFAGYTYVDVLDKKTTLKFLEVTADKYKEAIGDEFGKTVLGIFTDEPYLEFQQLPYTPLLFDEFKKRYGYDLLINLPLLTEETGNYRKIRHDTYLLVLDLFIDAWAKPYSEWCNKNKIALTGHYWEHIWGNASFGPDDMAMEVYSQIPGVDVLFNKYSNKMNSQFGNDMMVKEIKSVANQMGRERMLSETYGAAGWDLTFQDMKRIGDWEYSLGVNLMTQHLFWGSITGYRKYDHPPSFSYHSPYFKNYKILTEYYARLSAALSKGFQNNNILLLQPTTSNLMHWRSYSFNDDWKQIDSILMTCINSFHEITHKFELSQTEYDIGSEYLIREFGKIDGNQFCINKGRYSLVILPPYTQNLEQKTFDLLELFLKNGGKVLSTKNLPQYLDGSESNKTITLAELYKNNWIKVDNITNEEINKLYKLPIKFNIQSGNDKLYHIRKDLNDAQLVFISNADDSITSKGDFEIKGGSVQQLDLFSGKNVPYAFKSNNGNINVEFDLPPGGSILFCIKNEKSVSIKNRIVIPEKVELKDNLKIERYSPNSLIIDYCDLRLKDETFKNIYFFDAVKKIFNTYGFSFIPWSGIQYKKEFIDKKFPDESGFEADYKFFVDENVNLTSLKAVYERPDIFKVKINNIPINPIKGKWYIDKDFAVYDISKYVNYGENSLTIISKPMNILSELDRAIILGDFALESQTVGFKIVQPGTLLLGDWIKQGLQLYSDRVSYEHSLDIQDKKSNYFIKLPDWKGSCAEVYVNDKYAGLIAFNPYQLDISRYLNPGKNRIKVVIVGTLRNLFGPHHTKDAVTETWPLHFFSVRKDQGLTLSGDSYFLYSYGMMKDFEVWKVLK